MMWCKLKCHTRHRIVYTAAHTDRNASYTHLLSRISATSWFKGSDQMLTLYGWSRRTSCCWGCDSEETLVNSHSSIALKHLRIPTNHSPSTLWIKIRPCVVPGHGCLSRMHWEQCGCLLSHYSPISHNTPFFSASIWLACLLLSSFVCMFCTHGFSENLFSLCLRLQSCV